MAARAGRKGMGAGIGFLTGAGVDLMISLSVSVCGGVTLMFGEFALMVAAWRNEGSRGGVSL